MRHLLIDALIVAIVWIPLWLLLFNLHDKGYSVPLLVLRILNLGFFIALKDASIVKYSAFSSEHIALNELKKITYSFQAVASFNAIWEFSGSSDQAIVVGHSYPGLNRLLKQLETNLPGFSMDHWQTEFNDSGVEATFDVWPV